MKGQFRIINSRNALEAHIEEVRQKWEEYKWLQVQITTEKQRSQLQNNALHLWMTMLAHALNERGYDVRQILQHSTRAEIPWTMEAVKEHLWRPVQQQYVGTKSTTRASTGDYPAIYDILNKVLAEKFGIWVPWPTQEGMAAPRGKAA